MHFWSTSAVGAIERAKGDFELRTAEYPGMGEPPKGLPAGWQLGDGWSRPPTIRGR